jgi:hypothetical protein
MDSLDLISFWKGPLTPSVAVGWTGSVRSQVDFTEEGKATACQDLPSLSNVLDSGVSIRFL